MGALSWRKRWWMAALGGCVLVMMAAGCGSSGPSDSTAAAKVKEPTSGPTEAVLSPVGNSGVSGKVVYVEQPSGMPLMKIRLRGVKKATGETQYFIWQMGDRHHMTSFASYHVPHGAKLSVNLEPSLESLGWLKEGSKTQMVITLVENDDHFFETEEHWANGEDPTEIGEPVARGTFVGPLVGATGN